MNDDIKRTIILENYQNPKNKGLVSNNSYELVKTNSKSCIDQIDLQFKIENGIIRDVRFDGEACAICTSSTSIMINLLIDKSLEDALEIINNFENMIDEKKYEESLIKEAIVYSDISKQPNRKNCALLTWNGTKKMINRRLKNE